jgi:NifU-like protein involved in Fe-S cluster formation
MNTPLYDTALLRLAASIPYLERLPKPHGTADRRSPVCGSRVIVDVRMNDDETIGALGLSVSACALGQASACLMARYAVSRTVEELALARDQMTAWLAGDRPDPGFWPGLDQLARALPHSGRHAAIRLPFEAVAEAAAKARR